MFSDEQFQELFSSSLLQSKSSREHLQSLQPGRHQLLHRRRDLRGGGRRVALPGPPQQTAGVHGDIISQDLTSDPSEDLTSAAGGRFLSIKFTFLLKPTDQQLK